MILTLIATLTLSQTYGAPEPLCRLSESFINESSGLAASPTRPGVYYTHNDSGDKPRFFQFDEKGTFLQTITLIDADALDWEDMAAAKVDNFSFLYFADIGDNLESRKNVTIYKLQEPGTVDVENGAKQIYRRYELVYPDGPHNAEAFMVTPRKGDFWIVTKTDKGPSGVYWCAEPKTQLKPTKLRKQGTIKLGEEGQFANLVTGGDISPDGKHVVLRTYQAAYEFDLKGDWWKQTPRKIATAVERQGEAICYSASGDALITSSEGTPCPISRILITR